MEKPLRIGELATRTGCQVETIRYYEREGLLPAPERSEGNYRLYTLPHLEQLQFILYCRSLDMTLDEIRHLLRFREAPEENCAQVNDLLDKHIGHVASRIEQLKKLQSQLKALRSLCRTAQSAKECGILRSLSSAEGGTPVNLGSHGGGCH